MRRTERQKLAGRLAAAAGAVFVVTSAFMIVDQVAAMRRAPAEAALVAELEERVLTDAEAVGELEAERERQTERSVAREARNRRLGYVLLIAGAVFLGAANWKGSLGDGRRSAEGAGLTEKLILPPLPFEKEIVKKKAQEELDLEFVDTVIAREGRGRESLIPILQALQAHYRYLPEEALRRVCERTEITPAQIAGVASFYAQFRRTPMGEHRIRVCHGTACHVAGIGPIMDELRRRLGIQNGDDTDPERRFTLDPVACLGCCSLAPVLMIDDDVAGRLTPASAWEVLGGGKG